MNEDEAAMAHAPADPPAATGTVTSPEAAADTETTPARLGIGTPITEADIAAWDIDAMPDGRGLPPGSGSAREGAPLYLTYCAACHGPTGREGPMDRLAGGQGTLASKAPAKTVNSYWPHASTLFDYIRRSMPFTAPQSLDPDQVYALTAYVLSLDGIVTEDQRLDATTLPAIEMPNRHGFITPDPRPDTDNQPCTQDCGRAPAP